MAEKLPSFTESVANGSFRPPASKHTSSFLLFPTHDKDFNFGVILASILFVATNGVDDRVQAYSL